MKSLVAVKIIKSVRDKETDKEIIIALDCAIEALKRVDTSSCYACKYEGRNKFMMPCADCKRQRTDWWTYVKE